MTEKAVSRLAEEVPNYKHKLQDKEVHAHFMALVSRAKRLATPEMASAVAEWEAKLQKVWNGKNKRFLFRSTRLFLFLSCSKSFKVYLVLGLYELFFFSNDGFFLILFCVMLSY